MTLSGIIAYLTMSPYIFQEMLGLSPKENGLIGTITAFSAIIGAIINSKLLNKFKSEQLLFTSTILMILSSLSLFYLHFTNQLTITTFMISGILYFLSVNFAFSNGYALTFKQTGRNSLGTASALVSGGQHIIAMISSLIVSILPADNILPIAYMFFISGLIILLMIILTNKYSSNEMD